MALSETFVESVTVVQEDLDEMNHVTNLQYMLWTLKAAAAHSRKVGWSSDRCREIGAGWIVRSHKITYKVPALLGDRIEIRTWVEDFDTVSSMRRYEIVREADGRMCAHAETRWVFVDLQTAKLREIPESIIRAFRDGYEQPVDGSES